MSVKWAKDIKLLFADAELIEQRLAVCRVCPEFFAPLNQCKRCGCLMQAKTRLENAKCPLNKW